jgi:hypothetical protein
MGPASNIANDQAVHRSIDAINPVAAVGCWRLYRLKLSDAAEQLLLRRSMAITHTATFGN